MRFEQDASRRVFSGQASYQVWPAGKNLLEACLNSIRGKEAADE